jgi:hypothetical protein
MFTFSITNHGCASIWILVSTFSCRMLSTNLACVLLADLFSTFVAVGIPIRANNILNNHISLLQYLLLNEGHSGSFSGSMDMAGESPFYVIHFWLPSSVPENCPGICG